MSDHIQQQAIHNKDMQPMLAETTLVARNAIWEKCIESVDIFAKALKYGRVRGIIALTPPTDSSKNTPGTSVTLIEELLQRDIMVVLFGTSQMSGESNELADNGLAEFCDNLDIPPLLEMGGNEDRARFQEFSSLLAQNVAAEIDTIPVVTLEENLAGNANTIDEFIHEKRLKLAWCDRLHCSLFS